jgi:hypothetical protein
MLFLSILASEEWNHVLGINNLSCNLNFYDVLENYFYFKSTCSKSIFTIVNKQNKNLFLTYCYHNIYIFLTINFFCDSKGMYNNYGDDLAIIL